MRRTLLILAMFAVAFVIPVETEPPSPEQWTRTLNEDFDGTRLETLGSRRIRQYCYRNSWSMIAVKGEGRARQEALAAGSEARSQTRILSWNRPLWGTRTR